ncbi:WhiB family transcriptional regulator [Streptomyces sp. NPDC096153]|uniref:WhiB family transcriptional regulator n=1 Tax=Streptomyces sp. NPDC096153 TaxID=3155548 RepID=UPI003325E817
MNTRAPDTLEPAGRWRRTAACLTAPDPEIFFADTSQKQTIADAKTICRRCPVAVHCLIDAMNAEQASTRYGIFGGATHSQRRRLAQRMDETGQSLHAAAATFVDRLHREDDLLDEAYAQRTEAMEDGHVRWTVVSTMLTVAGKVYTPMQLGFIVAHGRRPAGVVRNCGMRGCVAPAHLTDTAMRQAARLAARQAVAA